MLRAVIFDLDNTLLDFMRMKNAGISAAVEAMMDAGLGGTAAAIEEGINRIYDEKGIEYQYVFDDFLERELGAIDHKILAAAILAYRQAKDSHLRTYPSVHQTLIAILKLGLKLAVISDAPRREAWLRICATQLQNYFDVVITYEDTHERKPHPKPFLLALDRLQVDPAEALMIGDWAERDMIGASKVGMKTVFARYGDRFETQHPGADYEISSISGLIPIVKKECRCA